MLAEIQIHITIIHDKGVWIVETNSNANYENNVHIRRDLERMLPKQFFKWNTISNISLASIHLYILNSYPSTLFLPYSRNDQQLLIISKQQKHCLLKDIFKLNCFSFHRNFIWENFCRTWPRPFSENNIIALNYSRVEKVSFV